MAYDRSREETRVSRSGRVLKKTLKMKEMEDLMIEEDGQEKNRRRFRNLPAHRKPNVTIHAANKRFSHTLAELNSSGFILSSSLDISGDDTLNSKNKSRNQVQSRNLKSSKALRMVTKTNSSESDRTWSTDVSSENESSSSISTDESSGDSDVHSARRGFIKMNLRWGGEKDKRTVKRKTNSFSKKRATNTKTVKSTSAARRTRFNSYAQKKTGRLKDINKNLIFRELSKRLGGKNLALPKKERVICRGEAKQPFSQESGHSSTTNCNGRPNSAATIKHINPQVKQESLELFEGNSTLGIAPIDVAAHLQLLGDNLSKIGMTVMDLNHIGPGVYSSLLDVLLCSVGPLLCLTREIAGLERLPEDVFKKMLDHIAYIIPGL